MLYFWKSDSILKPFFSIRLKLKLIILTRNITYLKHLKVHQNIKLLVSLLTMVILIGCERDDICAAVTPTTPHLIVRFYNINARSELKTVRRMTVTAEDNLKPIVNDKTTDSIVLPLKVDALGTMNTSRFVIKKDIDFDADENPITNSNADIIEISYTPELIYVSRACGYKSVYNDLIAGLDTDQDNWIIDIEVINTTINNEDAAHINIYH